MKIISPANKKDSITRDLRKLNGKFSSVIDMKVKLLEEFQELLPCTTEFSVGYFHGRQSVKQWLMNQDDLTNMYTRFEKE